MDEMENKLPEEIGKTDTVSGDIKNKVEDGAPASSESGAPVAPQARTPMSPRTKKRLIRVGIVTGAVLLVLAAVLIVVTIINNQPPELHEVRERFEQLIGDSQDVNEIVWGAGLPTYKRVDRQIKTFEVDVLKENGDPVTDKDGQPVKKTLRYYLYEDATLGTIVSYEYQARVAEGKTTEVEVNGQMQTVPVYTVYDVEKGGVLAEYKNGAARFAQKSATQLQDQTPIFEKDGYWYYALPNYENPDLATAGIYTGREDSRYDYVVPNKVYTSTSDVRDAIGAVYANAFVGPLYESLFTGTVGAVNDVYQAAYTDYTDTESDTPYLMKSNEGGAWKWRDPLPRAEFDFTTMQIVGGNAKKVQVCVEYHLVGRQELKVMEIEFVLENGEWLLNSPTFG